MAEVLKVVRWRMEEVSIGSKHDDDSFILHFNIWFRSRVQMSDCNLQIPANKRMAELWRELETEARRYAIERLRPGVHDVEHFYSDIEQQVGADGTDG